ncbi:MAG: WYL domain-containing protein [Bacilli bacterium]|nr:WYL domain-containing protein [Bacilli bacterium]
MIDGKKGSILLILKVLQEYTDENHFLTYNQIIEKIYMLYGLKLERKSVASSITILQDLEYDIVKGSNGGVSLFSRELEKSEITFLIDAIFSSKSIPGKEAKKLSDKISKTLSKYDRRDYNYLYKTSEVNRTSNKDIFLNIELIQEAINQNKRISFQYMTYNEKCKLVPRMNGYEYSVSPYYLVNNFGRYYLLCNYRTKYSAIQIFRLDYMQKIKIDKEREMKPLSSLGNEYKDFSLSKYLNEHIYLFGGDIIEVKIIVKNPNAIAYIYDWFGENARIFVENNVISATIKSNETALLYWLLQYGEHFKVIEPTEFKEKLKEKARMILED